MKKFLPSKKYLTAISLLLVFLFLFSPFRARGAANSDSFTGTNGTPLATHDANWKSINSSYPVSDLQLYNGYVRTNWTGILGGAYYNASVSDTSQIVLKVSGPSAWRPVLVRVTGSNGYGYAFMFQDNDGTNYNSVRISKNGAELATVFSGISFPMASDHTLKITASGTDVVTINGYVDDKLIITATDSSSPFTTGHPGFISYSGGMLTDTYVDSWTDGGDSSSIPPPVPVPTISSFIASPSSITSGQSTTLSWNVSGAASLSINNGVGDVASLSSKTVSPTANITYILTATNSSGSASQPVSITVNSVASPVLDIPAPPGGAYLIKTSHPRLLLTAERLAWLQSKKTANTPDWQVFKADTDTIGLTGNVDPYDATLASGIPALMYQLYRGSNPSLANQYADRAIAMAIQSINYYISQSLDPPNDNLYRSSNMTNLVLVYDWTYDRLSDPSHASDKALLQGYMQRALEKWITVGCCGEGGNFWSGKIRSNIWNEIALYGEYANVQTYYDRTKNEFINGLNPFFSTTGVAKGGAWGEGTQYDPESVAADLEFIEGVLSATGEDLYTQLPSFVPDRLLYTLQATSPAGNTAPRRGSTYNIYQLMPYGDIDNDKIEYISHSHRITMLEMVRHFERKNDTTNAAYTKYWLDNFKPFFMDGREGESKFCSFYNFLYYDPFVSAQNYGTVLAKDYLSIGMGRILTRSAWDSNATWAGFDGGTQYFNHQHADANQFQIFRKGRWLVKEVEGWEGGWPLSQLHSSLLLNGHGSGSPNPDSLGPISNGNKGMLGPSVVTRYESATDNSYTYTQGDATRAYQPRNGIAPDVSSFLRDFLYLRPDLFVVYDRVAYPISSPTVWNLTTEQAPTVSGNVITVTNNLTSDDNGVLLTTPAQSLFITSVSPASISPYVASVASTIPPPGWGSYLGYRTQVPIPPSTSASIYFVMQSADSGTTPIPVAKLISSGVTASQFDKYVVSALTGTSGSNVNLSYTYNLITGANLKHYVIGLNKSSTYKVSSVTNSSQRTITITDNSSASGTSLTTTLAGLLIFDDTLSSTISSSPPPASLSSTKFTAGQRVQTTSNLNVRATASASGTLLGTQSLASLGTIVSGGTQSDGYYWWNVNYDSGVDGWSVENYITPSTSSGSSLPLRGDFNGDKLVNNTDLLLMTAYWNQSNTTYDLNHDGIINTLDYAIMVQNWTL